MNRRSFAALALVLMVLGLQTMAFAAGSGTVTPNHVSVNGQRVHITWAGMAANQPIWIQQCDNVTVGYDQTIDCSLLSAKERQATFNQTGSGQTGTTGPDVGLNPDYAVFVGDEPSGDLGWACDSMGTPEGTVIGGVTHYNPCRIRVTDSSLNTTTNEFFLPVTFDSGPVVPEARIALLLPLGGAVVLAAAFFIVRRREKGPAGA